MLKNKLYTLLIIFILWRFLQQLFIPLQTRSILFNFLPGGVNNLLIKLFLSSSLSTRVKDNKLAANYYSFGTTVKLSARDFLRPESLKYQSSQSYFEKLYSVELLEKYIFKPITLLRTQLIWQAKKLLPSPHFALITGMVLGDSQNIPESLAAKIKTIGMSHILVASGFNVSLVALLFTQVAKVFRLKRVYFWLLVNISVLFYCLICGLSAPLSRAWLMFLLSSLLVLIYKKQTRASWNLKIFIFLAAVLQPRLLLSLSFQLSVAATIGIILIYPAISSLDSSLLGQLWRADLPVSFSVKNKNISFFHRCSRFFIDSFLLTLSAQLAVLPVILWHFPQENYSLLSLLANTLLIESVSLVTVWGAIILIISLVVSQLPAASLGISCLKMITFPIFDLFLLAVDFISQLPALSVSSATCWLILAIIYLYLLVKIIKKGWKNHAI